MSPDEQAVCETLDRFLTRELPLAEFEAWLYGAADQVEAVVGHDRALALLGLDFRRREVLYDAPKLAAEAYEAVRPGQLPYDRARRLALGILSRTVSLERATRALASLYYDGHEWIPFEFVALNSELDDLQDGAVRPRWNPWAFLRKRDELQDLLKRWRPKAEAAAQTLLRLDQRPHVGA